MATRARLCVLALGLTTLACGRTEGIWWSEVYASGKGQPDHEAHDLVEGDEVITRGTRKYFLAKRN